MAWQLLIGTPNVATNRVDLRITEVTHDMVDDCPLARFADFEWNGTRWRVRFQSWPRKPQESDPVIDLLDMFPEERPGGGY